MTAGAVLDPSAMVAYAGGSTAVGELLTMVAEEDRTVALPAAALAEAFSLVADADHLMLRLLCGHYGTIVAPLGQEDAEPVGVLAKAASVGVAHAVVLARDSQAYLVTAQLKAVAGLIDDELVIEV